MRRGRSGFAALSLIIVVLIIAAILIYMNKNPGGTVGADGKPSKTYTRELIDKAKASAAQASRRTTTLNEANKELGLE